MMPIRNLVAALAATVVAQSAAGATIGFEPTAQSVGLGNPVTVDVWVRDLGGEIVSAYDLDILYDATLVNALGVSFGSGLGDAATFEVLESFDVDTPGIVDLAQVSLLSDADLLGLQGGDEVRLGTLVFETLAEGTTTLAFHFDAVNDIKGANAVILAVVGEEGSIEVIPEPSTGLLVGLGLMLLASRRSARTGECQVGHAGER